MHIPSFLVVSFVLILVLVLVLIVVIMPGPTSAAALKTVARFSMKSSSSSKNNVILSIARGSVVDYSSPDSIQNDAIVNAANEGCLGGGGVDGAISKMGGINLHNDRLALPLVNDSEVVRCPTGAAVITGPNDDGYGSLLVNHVIHAVGPNYFKFEGFDEPDSLLRGAYLSSLECGRQAEVQAVAFSLLSAGVFRGSRDLEDVLKIGITGIRDWVQEEDPRQFGTGDAVWLCANGNGRPPPYL
jgi:O-acetyl-ADP-ribose deacetylase (regulator of RNase III)